MDTFDFLEATKEFGEGDRELEPDSSMMFVYEGEWSPVGVEADDARRREADRAPNALRDWNFPRNWTNRPLSMMK